MEKLLNLQIQTKQNVIKYNIFDQNNQIPLNPDIHYEICKYLGKIMGCIDKDLNKRWKNDGICIGYDHATNFDFPKDLEKYVVKIIAISLSSKLEKVPKFINLKKVHVCCRDFYFSYKSIIYAFGHLETIILDEKYAQTLWWSIEVNNSELKNIYISTDKSLLKYNDYQDFRNKYVDNKLLDLLRFRKFLDLTNESTYSVMLSDLVLVYLYLFEKISESQNYEKRLKISVIMTDDPLQIDFYIKIKRLYEEIGIEIDMDIYGKMSKCYYDTDAIEKQSLYSALKNFSRDDLESLIEKSIEFYRNHPV